ncbi:MAG: LOG family protein, partial [Gammaproteobacteria bacterium]
FALRKLHFLLRARAMVAFPGGFGTFDELFETLTLVQCARIAPMPIVLVGERYWRHAVDMDFVVAQGMIAARERRLFRYADTAREIWRAIAPGLR